MFTTIFSDLTSRMEGAIGSLKHNVNGLRTSRASAAILDPVKVDAYGSMMPLNQLATVNVPESRTLMVQVWDINMAAAVEKAIMNSGLGLNPMTEGNNIRINLPDLSEERRKELVKKASEYGEQSKISVRNIRRDGLESLKKLEKIKEISEDDLYNHGDEIQKLTDKFVLEVDNIIKTKTAEIMQI